MPKSSHTKFSRTHYVKVTVNPKSLRVLGIPDSKVNVTSRYETWRDPNFKYRDFCKTLGSYVRNALRLVKQVTTFEEAIDAVVYMVFMQLHKDSPLASGNQKFGDKVRDNQGLHKLPYRNLWTFSGHDLYELARVCESIIIRKEFPNLRAEDQVLVTKWGQAYAKLFYHNGWVKLDRDELSRVQVTEEILKTFLLHLPHVSEEKPEMIAYYQSIDKLNRTIETRTNAGRYFKKLFPGACDDLIRELATAHTQRVAGSDLKFVENTDPAEHWYAVYDNGPPSCIGDRPWAAEAYARPHNTLRLAYLGTMDNPTARSIVVDAGEGQKGYIRMYGDIDRLTFALKRAGYGTQVNMYDFGPVELQLLYRHGEVVCPYIDGDDPYATIHNNCIVIDSSGDHCAQNSDNIGFLNNPARVCDLCDDRVSEDDTRYIEGHGDVCDSCVDNHFCVPEIGNRYGDWFHNDDCVEVINSDGHTEMAVKAYVSNSDSFILLEQAYEGADFCHTNFAVYVDGVYYHQDDDDIVYLDYLQEYAYIVDTVADYNDERYLLNDTVTLHDGSYAYEGDTDLVFTRHGWALDWECTELNTPYDRPDLGHEVTHALDTDEEELARNEVAEEQEVTPV